MLNLTRRFLCCLALFSFAGTANGGESIAYRLSEWKQTHFNDVGEAEQHLASVKKLGCEAKIDSHAGHSDVVYRASRWNSMEVATDKLAHEWENWLKSAGFETIHGHVADRVAARSQDDGHDQSPHGHSTHDNSRVSHAGHNHGPGEAEEVAYQLPQWKAIHVEDERQLPEIVALLQGFGCEVRSENHGGHTDLKVRCATWKHIEFDSHKTASTWEAWLKRQGFVTRHVH